MARYRLIDTAGSEIGEAEIDQPAEEGLTVHAVIYRLDDGILRDLKFDVDSNRELLRKTPAR